MDLNQDKIQHLLERISKMELKQHDFSKEIAGLRQELEVLLVSGKTKELQIPDIDSVVELKPIQVEETKGVEKTSPISDSIPVPQAINPTPKVAVSIAKKAKESGGLEKFIGENLINKIGIIILIIGVAIGAKYSIEHNLISPVTRIILGYLMGISLLLVGLKLKKNYLNFSAVLVSGSAAIFYFITYSAYSFYGIFSQTIAFLLMVIFTVFTVLAALNYNKQIIAHIGLVGAYAVPFLLSEGNGNVAILFSYMVIINIGILSISLKKYWIELYYSAFALTWIIFSAWYLTQYDSKIHFSIAFIFIALFYILFYLSFLGNKLVQKNTFLFNDIVLLLANSFIFYGLGYTILSDHKTTSTLLGLFTLGNGLVHLALCGLLYWKKLADKNLFYLVFGLFLLFLTLAIPVQLDGSWVTLMWVGEALILFWIGKTKQVAVYEKIAYPLMLLSFLSLLEDWKFDVLIGKGKTELLPLLNTPFLVSILFVAAFGFITFLMRKKPLNQQVEPLIELKSSDLQNVVSVFVPMIFIFTLYYTFRIELSMFWDQAFQHSVVEAESLNLNQFNYYLDYDLKKMKAIWLINYTLFFISVLGIVNYKLLKSKILSYVTLSLILITVLVFLTQGLYAMSVLRESYITQFQAEFFSRGKFHLGIRYLSFVFLALTIFTAFLYTKQTFMKPKFKIGFDFLLHTSIVWILSSEIIHYLDLAGSSATYKLSLSILWGMYALLLVVIGIWKKKKHLRIGAISLFGLTLLKLFIYDIAHLNTISKTIVFVTLGLLLLVVSFLYNKYAVSEDKNE